MPRATFLPVPTYCSLRTRSFVFISRAPQGDIPASDVAPPRPPGEDLPKSQSPDRPSTSSSRKLMAIAVAAASCLLLLTFIWWFSKTTPNKVTPPPPSTSLMKTFQIWGSVAYRECSGTARLETNQLAVAMNLQKVEFA